MSEIPDEDRWIAVAWLAIIALIALVVGVVGLWLLGWR